MGPINTKTVHILSRLFIVPGILLMLSSGAFAKEVIGWVEKVGVSPSNVILKAKIDTGADSSSLDCECITPYERDGEQWVRFSVTDINDQTVSFEKKVVRTTRVKRHFGEVQKRMVVRMGICIGDQYGETDVSLVDRSGFNYSMLIGRKYLKNKFIVDPDETFLSHPKCKVD